MDPLDATSVFPLLDEEQDPEPGPATSTPIDLGTVFGLMVVLRSNDQLLELYTKLDAISWASVGQIAVLLKHGANSLSLIL